MNNWITKRPNETSFQPKVSLLQRMKRREADRRVYFGIWSRFQKRKKSPLPYVETEFRKEWVFLKHGDIRFPESIIAEKDYQPLINTGIRRAMHTKHPATDVRLIDIQDSLQFGPPQFYFQSDPETQYKDYLIYIQFDMNHLIKIELDIDKFGKLISEESYREFGEMLNIIPRWEG